MPGPSSAAERRPDSTTCPRAVRGTPPPAERANKEALRLVRGTRGTGEPGQTSPYVRLVLVTEGGLELPLVASPVQVARLLDIVSEMAAGVDRDGPLLSPRSRPATSPGLHGSGIQSSASRRSARHEHRSHAS